MSSALNEDFLEEVNTKFDNIQKCFDLGNYDIAYELSDKLKKLITRIQYNGKKDASRLAGGLGVLVGIALPGIGNLIGGFIGGFIGYKLGWYASYIVLEASATIEEIKELASYGKCEALEHLQNKNNRAYVDIYKRWLKLRKEVF